jgi:hypothetical protein
VVRLKKRSDLRILGVILGVLLVVSCGGGGDQSQTGVDVGAGRAFPYPVGTEAHGDLWKVQALDVVRGAEAWQRLEEANAYNEPPPEGQEYLLVQLKVGCFLKGKGDYFSYYVTGDRGIFYSAFAATPPEPRLSSLKCDPMKRTTGWAAFLIRAGEQNLILAFEEFVDYDYAYHYLALEEGARILIDMDLEQITPESDRGTKEAPVPLGETLTLEDWQVTIEDVVWDEAAWERIVSTNSFNDPPPPGRKYVLVKARMRYIGVDKGPVLLSDNEFSLLGSDEVRYEPATVVCPEPELHADLFSGARFTGWLCLEVDEAAERPLLIFEEEYPDGLLYFSLHP